MVATPERKTVSPKRDVDAKLTDLFYLRTAEYLMRYRPVDFVDRIAPRALLMTSVEDDVVTPADHAMALYERAGAPKKLIHQRETTHYRSYTDNYSVLMPQIIDWYDRYLKYGPIETRESSPTEEIVYINQSGG
jgi:dipeptidyl aminopeptidase/acylaminoacyl peptidase